MNISTNHLQLVKTVNYKSDYCKPEELRARAGLSIEVAAKGARICPKYLRQIERTGGASYALASRLARVYGCSVSMFLFKSHQAEGGHRDAALAKSRRGRNPRHASTRVEVAR